MRFLLLLICLSSVSYGGDLAFRHYTVSDGLASSTIYSGIQDREGYIWLATESGVNRFNGRSFELFTTDDGLADNDNLRVFQDSKDRIWFLSFNGRFSYFQHGKVYNDSIKPFLAKAFCAESFEQVIEDSKNRLWFSSPGNYLIMIDEEKVTRFRLPSRFSKIGGLNVQLDSRGLPEFRVGNEVYIYNDTVNRLTFLRKSIFSSMAQRSAYSESGLNFIIARDGVILNSGSKDKLILQRREKNASLFFYNALYHDSDNMVWLGTMGGGLNIYRFRNDSLEFVRKYLPESNIVGIFRDHENNWWFCSKDDGLFMLPFFGTSVMTYRKSESVLTENMYSVHVGKDGKIWFGGEHEVVNCVETTGMVTSYSLSESGNFNFRVNDIEEDAEGNIWLATNEFTYRISSTGKLDTVTNFNPKYGGPKAGKDMAVDAEGNIYVANYNGLSKLNPDRQSFELIKGIPFPTRIYCVHAFSSRIYLAGTNGLCEYQPTGIVPLYEKNKSLTARINSMTNIGDSILVISVPGSGVFILKGNQVLGQYNKSNGLPSNECRKVFANGSDLWIATNQGLVKCRLDKNNSLTGWRLFGTSNLLTGNDVRDVFVKNRMVCVATSAGINVFEDTGVYFVPKPPIVHMKSILVNGVSMPLDSVYNLEYDQNNLQILLETISFSSPDQIVCQYKFENSGMDWGPVDRTQLIISKLLPGNYAFVFRVKLNGGSWSPVKRIRVIIAEPFWQVPGFKVSIIILTGLLITAPIFFYLFYRNRLVKMKFDQQVALDNERQRISHDLHDDLGGSLTSISMNAKIIKQKKQTAVSFDKELQDIDKESTAAVEKFSDIVWAISSTQDHLQGLVSFLNEYVTKFSSNTGIECRKRIDFKADPIVMGPDIRRSIMLIVKEALNNIQKHSNADKVDFELKFNNGALAINISDNGIGFDPDVTGSQGIGLISMYNRARAVGGRLLITSELGKGTNVLFEYSPH